MCWKLAKLVVSSNGQRAWKRSNMGEKNLWPLEIKGCEGVASVTYTYFASLEILHYRKSFRIQISWWRWAQGNHDVTKSGGLIRRSVIRVTTRYRVYYLILFQLFDQSLFVNSSLSMRSLLIQYNDILFDDVLGDDGSQVFSNELLHFNFA